VTLLGWSIAGLIVLAPVGFWLLAWLMFRPYRIKRQREATRTIAEFHQRFNEHELDAICRDAFKCSELPSLRRTGKHIWKIREIVSEYSEASSDQISASISNRLLSGQILFRHLRKVNRGKSLR
jgi:hypothetical protein